MRKVLIYALKDPGTNDIRYVGKTVNLKNRMNRHKRDALSGNTAIRRNAWLRSLLHKNQEPVIQILEETNETEWAERERYYIALHHSEKLTNMTAGGETCRFSGENHWNYGKHLSKETKQKISIKAKQRWKTKTYDMHRRSWEDRFGIEGAKKMRQLLDQHNATRVVSEKTRQTLSAIQSKPIVLIDDDGEVCYEFRNARIAAEHLGCKRSNVNNRRRFGGKLLRKYRVFYKEDFK